MPLLNRLERALGRYAIPDISLYFVLGQVLVLGFALLGHFDVERIALLPAAVRAGEVWRVATFMFVPPVTQISAPGAVFLALGWYFFYLMGGALEQHWGVFRYNAFLFLGWLLTVAVSFLVPAGYATNGYLALTVFLAFAYLNPDFVIYIFFILPVKIKWLALLSWIGIGFTLPFGSKLDRVMALASVGNFLVFFSRDIVQSVKTGKRRMEWQAQRFGAENNEREPRHRCHTCGRTDVSDPQLDFRYCSKCANDECYCSEHIQNHVHVVVVPTRK